MYRQRTFTRYSIAFKQKVVSEIETIQQWIKKFGKTHLLNKVVHIQMKDEKDKIKELERQKRELESALAQAHLKIITLESTLKVMEEESGVVLKKSTVVASSTSSLKTKDSEEANTQ